MKLTDLAHHLWKKYITKGDFCIDATCGNGWDTLFLAKEILTTTKGSLLALDLQAEAIVNTQKLIYEKCPNLYQRVEVQQRSHTAFPMQEKPKLICYNLGFLPGSDKVIHTTKESTLESVEKALQLVSEGGVISILCYPGQEKGLEEYEALEQWHKKLKPDLFTTMEIKKSNAFQPPILILVEKRRAFRKAI